MNPKNYWELVRPYKTTIHDVVEILAYFIPISLFIVTLTFTYGRWWIDWTVIILYYFCLNSDLRKILVGEVLELRKEWND